MIMKDWVDEVARALVNTRDPDIGIVIKIIEKFCPFQRDVLYEPVDESARVFLRNLLEHSDWYPRKIELTSDVSGEELEEKAEIIIYGKTNQD